jgi:hypothetical protein
MPIRKNNISVKKTEDAAANLLCFILFSKNVYNGTSRYATKKLKSIVEKKGFVIYAAMTIKNIVTIIENLLK